MIRLFEKQKAERADTSPNYEMFLCTQVECIWTFCCCSICSVTLPPQQFWLTVHCHHCFVALVTRLGKPQSSEEKMKMEAWRGRVGVMWTSLWKTLGHLVPCEPCWDATDMEDGPNFTTLNSKTPTPTTILQVQVVLKPENSTDVGGLWSLDSCPRTRESNFLWNLLWGKPF